MSSLKSTTYLNFPSIEHENMNDIQSCIVAYENYVTKLAGGFMNAASEGALTASIGLTHSQISGSFLDQSYFASMKAQMSKLKSLGFASLDEQEPTTDLLTRYPDLHQMLDLMEKGAHESIHALQKHSYRSVVSLVNAMQTIENWETKLFFAYAQSGGTWNVEESFLQCLDAIDDNATKLTIARQIRSACNVVLEAFSPRKEGLSLAHLIEGQAYVGGRLAVRAFDAFPRVDDLLYTKAWDQFVQAGGTEPILFVLLTGAAMRFGDINDDEEGIGFREFYPNPIDLYIYLLKYVPVLEKSLLQDSGQVGRLFGNVIPFRRILEASEAYSSTQEIDEAVSQFFKSPPDSRDPDFSYLLYKSKSDDYDNEDEMLRFREKLRTNVLSAFSGEPINMPSADHQRAFDQALQLSRRVAGIVGRTYSRVSEPTTNAFKKGKHKKIADAVGEDFALVVKNANTEEIFLQAIFDQSFLQGTLFPYFLDHINERVFVQPFDGRPPMSHIEYRSMCLMPEMIKGLLAVYQWRHADNEIKISRGPYCCEKHGHRSLDQSDPLKFDECTEDDSLGKAFKIGFGRSISNCME